MTEIESNRNFFLRRIKNLLELKADTDYERANERIRSGIEFRSANAWSLIFAIVLASVGLNMNSTAVIIGAMLISPLMGPIVGFGYALAIYDDEMLRASARNLAFAILISLVASTIYFVLSPISSLQSELLARTRPSFYDVLIAFVGGAAGVVALTRKEFNNVIPGVAIATALMPPLCTIGFGLATLDFGTVFGALYLFLINAVFISISTFLGIKLLGFQQIDWADPIKEKRIHFWLAIVASVLVIPSFILVWYLHREHKFFVVAENWIKTEIEPRGYLVVRKELKFSYQARMINLQILGEGPQGTEKEKMYQALEKVGISSDEVKIQSLDLTEGLENKMNQKVGESTQIVMGLKNELLQIQNQQKAFQDEVTLALQLKGELEALGYPIVNVVFGPGDSELYILRIHWKDSPSQARRKIVEDYLNKRLVPRVLEIKHLKLLP